MGGENILLFAFELKVDAERVIQGEPWAFDRHLVVFEKFDSYAPIHTLGFKSTAFWVQIHNLPFPLQTIETAFSIGETIGPVIKPKDLGEMLGPNFMRVKVVVDVSKPLCRGRKIYWDKDEGWATFMYERLPNICHCLMMIKIVLFGCEVRVLWLWQNSNLVCGLGLLFTIRQRSLLLRLKDMNM